MDEGDLLEIPGYLENTKINDLLNKPCSCEVGTQVCPADSFSPPPPRVDTPSGDVLIGGCNIFSKNDENFFFQT